MRRSSMALALALCLQSTMTHEGRGTTMMGHSSLPTAAAGDLGAAALGAAALGAVGDLGAAAAAAAAAAATTTTTSANARSR